MTDPHLVVPLETISQTSAVAWGIATPREDLVVRVSDDAIHIRWSPSRSGSREDSVRSLHDDAWQGTALLILDPLSERPHWDCDGPPLEQAAALRLAARTLREGIATARATAHGRMLRLAEADRLEERLRAMAERVPVCGTTPRSGGEP